MPVGVDQVDAQRVLQVHDELVPESHAGAVGQVDAGRRQRMAAAAESRVPLKVDVGRGANWDEAN
jgi:DNA polymerase-1